MKWPVGQGKVANSPHSVGNSSATCTFLDNFRGSQEFLGYESNVGVIVSWKCEPALLSSRGHPKADQSQVALD